MSDVHPLELPLARGLLSMLGAHRWGYVVSVVGILVRHAATALAAVAGGVAVGRALDPSGSITVPSVVAVVCVAVAGVACWVENYASHVLSFRILADLRVDLVDRLARLPRAVLSRSRSGDLATAAGSDAEALEVFYAHSSLYVIASAALTPVFVILVGLASVPVAVVLAVVVALALVVPLLLRRTAERQGAAGREAVAALAVEVDETVGSLREVVAFELESRQRDRLERAGRRVSALGRATTLRSGAESAVAGTVVGVGVLVAIAILTPDLAAGRRSLAETLALVAAVGACPAPVQQLVTVTRHWSGTAAAAARIGGLLRASTPRPTGVLRLPDRPPSVHFDDVHAAWPTERGPVPALRGASFVVRAGETFALAGASGAGKSTALALLGQAMRPDRGTVSLDGRALGDLDPDALRARVSVVPQDTFLFADTVRANLLLGAADDEPDEVLQAALRRARADDIVAAMPDGLDTVLAPGGGGLSGGERQRLALARALVRRPRLLVLDESLSQLDARTVAELGDTVLAGGDRTTVLVAHRPATLLAVDRVAVLDHGRVVDVGTPTELLGRCAAFRALVNPSHP